MDPTSSPEPRRRGSLFALIASFAAIVALGVGFLIGGASARAADPAPPRSDSAEAGFARAMQTHHNQGVQLAFLVRDRTDDEPIRSMAYDIATTQAQQSGQMYGWLAAWQLPQYTADPPMAWMQEGGMQHQGMSDAAQEDPGTMPGLATPEQIAELTAASGIEAERIFLRLMIAHHTGAVEMAKAVIELSDDPAVTALAGSIVKSQSAELKTMRSMLAERE